MTIQAVIFDLGNVLDVLDDPPPWLARRDAMAARFGMTGEAMWELLYHTEPWQLVKTGKITELEFWDRVLSPLGVTDKAVQSAFIAELFEGHDQVNPTMRALLHELKPHYRLALLSNTSERDLETWLATRDLAGVFEVIVSSAKVGLAKPDPDIYHLTLERLRVAPDEALFVDDLSRNIVAAGALGIQCILFKTPAQARQELILRGVLAQAAPET